MRLFASFCWPPNWMIIKQCVYKRLSKGISSISHPVHYLNLFSAEYPKHPGFGESCQHFVVVVVVGCCWPSWCNLCHRTQAILQLHAYRWKKRCVALCGKPVVVNEFHLEVRGNEWISWCVLDDFYMWDLRCRYLCIYIYRLICI